MQHQWLGSITIALLILAWGDPTIAAPASAGVTTRVVNYLTNRPAAGVRVLAESRPGGIEAEKMTSISAESDNSGVLNMLGALPGRRYTLSSPQWALAYDQVPMPDAGQTGRLGDLKVLPKPSIDVPSAYVAGKNGYTTIPAAVATQGQDDKRLTIGGSCPRLSLEDAIVATQASGRAGGQPRAMPEWCIAGLHPLGGGAYRFSSADARGLGKGAGEARNAFPGAFVNDNYLAVRNGEVVTRNHGTGAEYFCLVRNTDLNETSASPVTVYPFMVRGFQILKAYEAGSGGIVASNKQMAASLGVFRARFSSLGANVTSIEAKNGDVSGNGGAKIVVKFLMAGDMAKLQGIEKRCLLEFRKFTEGDPEVGESWVGTGLNGSHIASIAVENGDSLSLVFNAEGKAMLSEVTRGLIGKQLGIFFNGKMLAAPTIMEPITGGVAKITGEFPDEMAALIKAGDLPLDFREVEWRAIPATPSR